MLYRRSRTQPSAAGVVNSPTITPPLESITLTCRRRVEQRPPIHDGDESRIGRDLQKKALTGPVDGIRSVVAEPDLGGEQWLKPAPGATGRCVKISGHQRPVGRDE